MYSAACVCNLCGLLGDFPENYERDVAGVQFVVTGVQCSRVCNLGGLMGAFQ